MKLLLAAGGTHLFSRRRKLIFKEKKINFQGENLAVRTCMAGQVPPQATPIKALRKMKSRTFLRQKKTLRTINRSAFCQYFIWPYICSSCYRVEEHEEAREKGPNTIDLGLFNLVV